MLSLRRCRDLLTGAVGSSDVEVEQLRDQLHAIAEVAVEGFIAKERVSATRSPTEARPHDNSEDARPAALRLIAEPERHAVEERAAIMEYEGGLDRDHAERRAVLHVVRGRGDNEIS